MIDLNKIEAAAKAATPGPWVAAGPSFGDPMPRYLNCVGSINDDDEFEYVCESPWAEDDCASADMAYIATANPATVLELVQMIRAKDDLIQAFRESERELMDQRDERDAVLRQALEALESQKAYIEANEPGLVTAVPAIAAIKEMLK